MSDCASAVAGKLQQMCLHCIKAVMTGDARNFLQRIQLRQSALRAVHHSQRHP